MGQFIFSNLLASAGAAICKRGGCWSQAGERFLEPALPCCRGCAEPTGWPLVYANVTRGARALPSEKLFLQHAVSVSGVNDRCCRLHHQYF